ncbi:hypothetical protein H0A66_18580 [Alcaligenaceae bacterium]|nr:hypothetical protein [Alcaligenaceae bacterium]
MNTSNESGVPLDASEPHAKMEGKECLVPPLLTALVSKAQREGHTMQHLAQVLDVSYARLNQWRRGESHIGNAQRSVHELAAKYLGIPVVFVQVLAQNITLPDLFWPDKGDFELRVEAGIQELFDDPFMGGFVPPMLLSASVPVKLFVLFLYRELNAQETGRLKSGSASWLRVLQDAISTEGVVRRPVKV